MATIQYHSLLDTDLYKFTMQQAIMQHYPTAEVSYQFTNRAGTPFTREAFDVFRLAVEAFASVSLTAEEKEWLRKSCPYFTDEYLSYLASYRFKPSQVEILFTVSPDRNDLGAISIRIAGPWLETVLWEVPLMAILSEVYFAYVDKNWSYNNPLDMVAAHAPSDCIAQEALAYHKAYRLLTHGCTFSEFGTRRRRSYHAQDIVMRGLVRAAEDYADAPGKLSGTSNVHFAMKYGTAPIGTIAHEWFMGVSAITSYDTGNIIALKLWQKTYKDKLLIALTDTFSTKVFFSALMNDPDGPEIMQTWTGLRQDSGDPLTFARCAKEVYNSLGIDNGSKVIVFSDSLDVDHCLKLREAAGKGGDGLGFIVSFGIGTHLTNDFNKLSSLDAMSAKSKALNIVIKISSINGRHCVKISDDIMKNTGDTTAVHHVKQLFGLHSL
ncbi:nicotinate phosphoribosyltransferase [Fistulina hepatica ATCC 64428]|uniref:Nicotinate phosphoribosyltransferase n=1 Tax=Fistulina hepatica ATCC 64428 TaxID=1128425 RepID=A0A0D7AP70_9AGAR|nr:nicotinate phosphoribosyltransferase [Fistulina hepatica ATCC 64428]